MLVHHQVKSFDSQRRVFREVTHYQAVLDDPDTAADQIRYAIDVCRAYSLPVYLEVPRDMVDSKIRGRSGVDAGAPGSKPGAVGGGGGRDRAQDRRRRAAGAGGRRRGPPLPPRRAGGRAGGGARAAGGLHLHGARHLPRRPPPVRRHLPGAGLAARGARAGGGVRLPGDARRPALRHQHGRAPAGSSTRAAWCSRSRARCAPATTRYDDVPLEALVEALSCGPPGAPGTPSPGPHAGFTARTAAGRRSCGPTTSPRRGRSGSRR